MVPHALAVPPASACGKGLVGGRKGKSGVAAGRIVVSQWRKWETSPVCGFLGNPVLLIVLTAEEHVILFFCREALEICKATKSAPQLFVYSN